MEKFAPRTIDDIAPHWPARRASTAPNIVTVILDDTGWSDFGCFGSEVATPNIDALSRSGVRYNNFHVTPLCSPTRACLLTGRNHHSVGVRFLADIDTGFDNSRGRIDPDIATIPELLRQQGYGTYLAGKWHLTPYHELSNAGPFGNWPNGRGFDRFYGFLDGCTDQYFPELYRDNQQVHREFPSGYHLSEDLVDEAIGWISSHRSFREADPFYLQLAFGATHAPLQVPKRYIDKYIEIFAKGWDATRDDRLARQMREGLVPAGTELTERPEDVQAWSDLDPEARRLFIHQQATYAGFLEHTDEQIGRLLQALDRLGVQDDTMVAVFSDNGAVLEGGSSGATNTVRHFGGFPETVQQQLQHLDGIGGPEQPAHYPKGWGMASNTPFRRFKQYVDLGGVRSPLVVSWPKGMAAGLAGTVNTGFAHVIDLAATIATIGGCDTGLMHGKSMAGGFAGDKTGDVRKAQYWEMMGRRAIWGDGWRAVAQHEPGSDYADDVWTLFDLRTDFAECRDQARENPGKLQELQRQWHAEAERHGVFPLDDRRFLDLLRYRSPLVAQDRHRLSPASGHVPLASGICGTSRSMTLTAMLAPGDEQPDGIIASSGNHLGGYVLFVDGGRLMFEHRCNGTFARAVSERPIPLRAAHAGVALSRREGAGAELSLLVDGETVATAIIPAVSHQLSYWGFDVGRCGTTPVTGDAAAARPYSGRPLLWVELVFSDAVALGDISSGRE